MKLKYFGTDGIRGRAGEGCLTEGFARRLGIAYARYLAQQGRENRTLRVVIGRDSRLSGEMLRNSFVSGFCSAGGECVDLGLTPTPSVALAVRRMGVAGGVMVTASHNPADDNGIKFFDQCGYKYTVEEEHKLEALVDRISNPGAGSCAPKMESCVWTPEYMDYIVNRFSGLSLKGTRIVLDASCGATAVTSAAVIECLGAEVIRLNCEADGGRINAGIGSEHPEVMVAAVREHKADLGIAHDGDGDRLVVCDDTGELVPGDQLLGMFALHGLAENSARYRTLVTTMQSNLGLDEAVRTAGGEVIRTDIGDRNVLQEMLRSQALIGGENSGHYIFLEDASTGDGLVAALHVMAILAASGRRLSELRQQVRLYPQKTKSLVVTAKPDLSTLAALAEERHKWEAVLGKSGRIFIRYSGTEPKLRFLVEGRDESVVDEALAALVAATKRDLGQ